MLSKDKEAQHALLSPSSSHRWMHCPGSVALTKDMPNESNAASRLGTAAHALAVEILSGHDYGVGDVIKFRDGETDCSETIDEDMLKGVLVYTEHINNLAEYAPNPELWLEQRLKLFGTFGTGDAILRDGVTLNVLDYKNGRVPVLLKDGEEYNSQLLFYAAAALKKYDKHREIQWVVLHVVQPNCSEVNQIQTEKLPAAEVRKWAELTLKPAMKAAMKPNAPLCPGDWCRFCPGMASCPALLKSANELAAADFADVAKPALPAVSALTTKQVANILKWSPILDAFLAAVASRALAEMQNGAIYPGFKLVRKKTNRAWVEASTQKLTVMVLRDKLILAGAPETLRAEELIGEAPLLSPKGIEDKFKLWGKKAVAKVAIKPIGDLTVAADSDPREAIQPAHDFAAVTAENAAAKAIEDLI
jgi:hypothetical protein